MLDLCLMVKNEEKYLERCILSAKDIVDNIIILDTGSTDNTKIIAQKYATIFFEHEFNGNYAYMRQLVLDKSNNEWILFLDADEYFDIEQLNKIKELLLTDDETIGGYRFVRYNFFSNGGWYTDEVTKLYRNRNFSYDKLVTEKIDSSIIQKGCSIKKTNIFLNHTGHCKSRLYRDEKTKKYIRLLKEQVKETESDDLLYSYLGINYGNIGMFDKALNYCKQGVEMNSQSVVGHVFLGNIYRTLNQVENAIDEYKRAIDLSNDSERIQNLLGVCYLTRGELKKAREIFVDAYNKRPFTHILVNLGLTYYFEECYEKAIETWDKVINDNRGFLDLDKSGVLEHNIFDRSSYETIQNYIGLKFYYSDAKNKIGEK